MRGLRLLGLAILIVLAGCGDDSSDSGDRDGGDGGGGDDGGDDGGGADSGPPDSMVGGPCSTPMRACGGPAVGACRPGLQYCVDGVWGPCVGEVLPTAAESCNNIDDDCDGVPAAGQMETGLGMVTCGVGACRNGVPACQNGRPNTMCTPGTPAASETCNDGIDNDCNGVIDDPAQCMCIFVAQGATANDANPGTSPTLPKRTISSAITAAMQPGNPKAVCVAAGVACVATPNSVDYMENVTMVSGVSVLGGYQPGAAAPWTRSLGRCVTRIVAPSGGADRAVFFDSSITAPTMLSGFTVVANDVASNQAILVSGATGAEISDNVITGGGGSTSIGVNIVASAGGSAANARLTHNVIIGGTGSAQAIGVRVASSVASIGQHCGLTGGGSGIDAQGRCTPFPCTFTGSMLTHYIRGRLAGNFGAGTASETYAIRLENAAGTSIDQNALCSSNGQGDAAAVRLSGAASQNIVLRGNNVLGNGGGNTTTVINNNGIGVWAEDCGGASPWLVNNFMLSGESRTPRSAANPNAGHGEGVRAMGNCHVRVDSNRLIIGGEESGNNDAIAVNCAQNARGVPSRCTILGNESILGSQAGFPPTSTGVKCDAGACLRIENNRRISGNQGTATFGVVLSGAATVVNNNGIDAGCTRTRGIGLLSVDAPARVQNNIISGSQPCTGGAAMISEAVVVQASPGSNELDLHSNTLHGQGTPNGATCLSRGLVLERNPAGAPPTGPRGVYRNNIIHAGGCTMSVGVNETDSSTDPRVFENNDIWPAGTLYRDENATVLTTATAVNTLVDPTAMSNLSADPLWRAPAAMPPDYGLMATSMCRNTGTATAAPSTDYGAQTRPAEAMFDIGAEEFIP